MLGEDAALSAAPFFWSNHYDLAIRYSGHAPDWDAVEIDGDLDAHDATARYFKAGRLVAAASIGRDRENLEIAEALAGGGGDNRSFVGRSMAGAGSVAFALLYRFAVPLPAKRRVGRLCTSQSLPWRAQRSGEVPACARFARRDGRGRFLAHAA